MHLLAMFALAATTFAQTFRVAIEPSSDGPESVRITMLDGPDKGESASHPGEWTRWVRAATQRHRHMQLEPSDEVDEADVREFVEHVITKKGVDAVTAPPGSRWESVVAEVSAKFLPLFVTAVVVVPGKRLDPFSGSPWSGVGHFVHDEARRVGMRVGDELFTERVKLIEHLKGAHKERPDQRWIFEGAEWEFEDMDFFRGVGQASGHGPYVIRSFSAAGVERWLGGAAQPLVIELGKDGAVRFHGELVLDPVECAKESFDGDPYGELHAQLMAEVKDLPLTEVGGSEITASRVLVRAHPQAPFRNVLELQGICASSDVRLARFDLALAGKRPIMAQGLTTPLKTESGIMGPRGEAAPDHPILIVLGITESKPPERAARSRSIRLPGGPVDSVGALEKLLRGAVERGQSMGLKLDVGSGVTVDDVLPVVTAAREAGVKWVTSRPARR